MADVKRHREAVIERVLNGPGKASNEQRRAAFANAGVAEPARALIDKVASQAWTIEDADVEAVKAKLSEDEIFELVVCAAIGKASRQLERAMQVIADVEKP